MTSVLQCGVTKTLNFSKCYHLIMKRKQVTKPTRYFHVFEALHIEWKQEKVPHQKLWDEVEFR